MTERDIAQARLLRIEAERVRLLLEAELEPSSRRLLAEHLAAIESRRFDLLAWIISIPDDKVRLICLMRFAEAGRGRRSLGDCATKGLRLRRFSGDDWRDTPTIDLI